MIRYGHQKNGEQEYKCNRCEARFNRRKGTPLEGLRTPIYVIVMAMAMYMCGVGVGMIAAVTGLSSLLYFRQATYEFDARQGQWEAKTYS